MPSVHRFHRHTGNRSIGTFNDGYGAGKSNSRVAAPSLVLSPFLQGSTTADSQHETPDGSDIRGTDQPRLSRRAYLQLCLRVFGPSFAAMQQNPAIQYKCNFYCRKMTEKPAFIAT